MRRPAMKICPTCKRRYADSLQFCLEDGTVLEAAREPEPTLVDPQATLRLTPRETNPPAQSKKSAVLIKWLALGGALVVAMIVMTAAVVLWQLNANSRSSRASVPNQNATSSPAAPAQSNGEISQEIERVNNEVGTALVNNDPDALTRLLANDYRYVTDAGLTLNKLEVLTLMRTGNLGYEYLRAANSKVWVNSDATKAELTGTAESKGQLKHQTFTDTYFYRNTYEKRDGRWQLVSGVVWHRQ